MLGDIEGEALARVTVGINGKGGKAEAVTGDLTEEAGATRQFWPAPSAPRTLTANTRSRGSRRQPSRRRSELAGGPA